MFFGSSSLESTDLQEGGILSVHGACESHKLSFRKEKSKNLGVWKQHEISWSIQIPLVTKSS